MTTEATQTTSTRYDEILSEVSSTMADKFVEAATMADASERQNAIMSVQTTILARTKELYKEWEAAEEEKKRTVSQKQEAFRTHAKGVLDKAWSTIAAQALALDSVPRFTYAIQRNEDGTLADSVVILSAVTRLPRSGSNGGNTGGGRSVPIRVTPMDGSGPTVEYPSSKAAKEAILKIDKVLNAPIIKDKLEKAGYKVEAVPKE